MSEVAERIRRIPDPGERVPTVSWPALAVFVGALAIWGLSTGLYLADVWSWPVSTLVNWMALYMFFTVGHEASHRTISTSEGVNRWLGRVSFFFLVPWAGFGLFRFVHMQHHRFAQHDDGRDPDYFASHGKGWTLPLRWAAIDLSYFRYWLPKVGSRPRAEKLEVAVTLALFVALAVLAVVSGLGFELLVLVVLPSRLAVVGLGFGFDWMPHHGLNPDDKSDRFKTTRNRIGLERVLTPLMLYQNYHLVHHLHPVIPFHRYIAVWRRNEEEYLGRGPMLSTALGRELTVDEYRRLRELDH